MGAPSCILSMGLFTGNGQGDFLPHANLTLAEVVRLAAVIRSTYRADHYTVDQTSGEHWWDTYVAYALDAGTLEPDEFTYFSRPTTRGDTAGILEHALPDYELPPDSYLSPPDVEGYSASKPETRYSFAISRLYSLGIIQGCDVLGNYHPDGSCRCCGSPGTAQLVPSSSGVSEQLIDTVYLDPSSYSFLKKRTPSTEPCARGSLLHETVKSFADASGT